MVLDPFFDIIRSDDDFRIVRNDDVFIIRRMRGIDGAEPTPGCAGGCPRGRTQVERLVSVALSTNYPEISDSCVTLELAGTEGGPEMLIDGTNINTEELSHLGLCRPDGLFI